MAAVTSLSVLCSPRMAGFDGSAWDEEEEEPAPDHQYYNDFPGKEPPIGGVVDMRLQDGAAQTPNHLGATLVRLWACPLGEAPTCKGDVGTLTGPWVLLKVVHVFLGSLAAWGVGSRKGDEQERGWGLITASPCSLLASYPVESMTPRSSMLLPKVM